MPQVWIATHGWDYEGYEILAAFSTREAAHAHVIAAWQELYGRSFTHPEPGLVESWDDGTTDYRSNADAHEFWRIVPVALNPGA